MNFQVNNIPYTPAFVVDEALLRQNLRKLYGVKQRTGCKILLALKGFAMHAFAPLICEYLDGVASSSLNEALLGREKFNREVHIYAPAYLGHELEQLAEAVDHVVFNSLSQFRKYAKLMRSLAQNKGKKIEFALRVNHGYSEVKVQLYNPCAPGSRFGVLVEDLGQLTVEEWELLSGLHFHTMCQQGSDVLARTARVIENRVGLWLKKLKWINFGGGHHITREDYDIDLLCKTIEHFKKNYELQVYLEPGEAIALNTGFLVTEVQDIIFNTLPIAILDTSATAHMPDVIEMPYRPEIIGAGLPGVYAYTYRLGGLTCLAGDVVGDYSFKEPLKIGDRFVFTDMAHYTMVKTTQFNGINLPDIAMITADSREYKVVRHFSYPDYRDQLS